MGDYLSALSVLGQWQYWVALCAGVFLVGTIGLIPGVGITTVAAVALPFLLFNIHEPLIALTFLAAVGGVANTLDSVPAILLGYPSASTQVTFLEGHQLAMQGRAAHTLGAVYAVSAVGGIVGAVCLLIAMPFIRPILTRISFPEIAAMALFGVLMVSALSRGAMLKGLIGGFLGILIGSIGTSYISGLPRFDMGAIYLFDGPPLIPTIIGLFALPELIDLTMRATPVGVPGSISNREVFRGARYGLSRWRMTVRQSIFGVFLGAVPGIGSTVVDWLAYAFGIAFTKDKSTFGRGNLDGVLFAESAQNSKEGGQAIPTLAFGIPGGLSWAIILVAMTIYGVHPGLTMLERDLDITMAIIMTLALGNLMVTMMGLVATGQLAKLTLIPYPLLAAVLLPLVFMAAFLTTQSWGDIIVLSAMCALGLTMKWLGWPRPPVILGFILGPIIEQNLWPSWQLWGWGFAARPLTIGLILAAVASVFYLTRSIGRAGATAEMVTGGVVPEVAGSPPVAEPSGPSAAGSSEATAGVVTSAGGSRGVQESFRITAAGLFGGLSLPRLRFGWRWETIFTLVLLVIVGWFAWESSQLRDPEGQFLPTRVSSVLLALLAWQFLAGLLTQEKPADIMDLGMRTGTDFQALKRLGYVVAWLAGLVLLSGIVEMRYVAVAFALAFGVIHVGGAGWTRIFSLIPAAVIAIIIFAVFGNLMVIEWPSRFILEWFNVQ